MANYTTINKPTDHFNTLLYVADQTNPRNITGVGFQPDWVWLHNRTQSVNNIMYDAVRGATKEIYPNATTAQQTAVNGLKAFITDGFTFGNDWGNQSTGDNYVNWNWKANGAGSSNSNGSIASTVSANTTAGFSIVKWAGSGANATIGHGLGAAPEMVVTKSLGTSSWGVYHKGLGNTNVLFWDNYGVTSANVAYWNNTSPTSTVFSVGTDSAVNHSGNDMIAYCFRSIRGYSRVSTYIGNGNANGTVVHTGFKPAMVFFKRTTGAVANWQMWDNKRDPDNPVENAFHIDSNDADGSPDQDIDFLSNGFKIRSSQGHLNANGVTFVYYAVAEEPLVGTNKVCSTAR
tara:strand:+ start:950 stop:1987 length:1038 start_codon:yes stop_codon:yes gene_type:complete